VDGEKGDEKEKPKPETLVATVVTRKDNGPAVEQFPLRRVLLRR